jgi:hypothetical protein
VGSVSEFGHFQRKRVVPTDVSVGEGGRRWRVGRHRWRMHAREQAQHGLLSTTAWWDSAPVPSPLGLPLSSGREAAHCAHEMSGIQQPMREPMCGNAKGRVRGVTP